MAIISICNSFDDNGVSNIKVGNLDILMSQDSKRSKEAKIATIAISDFFKMHDFTEDENDLFFNAALSAAVAVLNKADEPTKDLKIMEYICRNHDVERQEIFKYIGTCIPIVIAMADADISETISK